MAPPRDLPDVRRLALDVAGPALPGLRAAGQAVIVERAPATAGAAVTAYAWHRAFTTTDPGDPALRAFLDYWLGRAAG